MAEKDHAIVLSEWITLLLKSKSHFKFTSGRLVIMDIDYAITMESFGVGLWIMNLRVSSRTRGVRPKDRSMQRGKKRNKGFNPLPLAKWTLDKIH